MPFPEACVMFVVLEKNNQTKLKEHFMKALNLLRSSALIILAAFVISVLPAQSTLYAASSQGITKVHNPGNHKKHKKHKKSGKKTTTTKDNSKDKNKTNNNTNSNQNKK
jgi:archaellum component FlaF (FlaF/FlaG flagellin family)